MTDTPREIPLETHEIRREFGAVLQGLPRSKEEEKGWVFPDPTLQVLFRHCQAHGLAMEETLMLICVHQHDALTRLRRQMTESPTPKMVQVTLIPKP